MKDRMLSNKGFTLIELIVAAVILGIIAVPLLNTILEVTKSTVKSDIELKMNAEVQKVIEEIKATGEYPKQVLYYDRLFREQANNINAFYKMEITAQTNNVDSSRTSESEAVTDANFDRWDYEVAISRSGDINSTININTNMGNRVNGTGMFNPEPIDLRNGSLPGIGNKLVLNIVRDDILDQYKLVFDRFDGITSVENSGEEFLRPIGTNGYVERNNSIVVRVKKYLTADEIKNGIDIPAFDIDISNSTSYNQGNTLKYKKHLIVNIVDDSTGKITVNPLTSYIEVNKNLTSIEKQREISCKIIRIGNGENLTMKQIKSTVGKPVKLENTVY